MACINASLILLAHGSKDPKWCKSFEPLVVEGRDLPLHLAYMDFIEPSLATITQELANDGINMIKVLPLFMSSGGHTDKDIPEQVNKLKLQFPNITFEILPPIGEHSKIVTSMKEIIKEYAKEI